jgi:hypothetical protein
MKLTVKIKDEYDNYDDDGDEKLRMYDEIKLLNKCNLIYL